MPEVGDRVRVESSKLGQAVREGVVTDVHGQLLRVRWSTGEESTFTPGPGSVTVTGRIRRTPSKKAAAPTNKSATAEHKTTAKRAVVKKNAAPRKGR